MTNILKKAFRYFKHAFDLPGPLRIAVDSCFTVEEDGLKETLRAIEKEKAVVRFAAVALVKYYAKARPLPVKLAVEWLRIERAWCQVLLTSTFRWAISSGKPFDSLLGEVLQNVTAPTSQGKREFRKRLIANSLTQNQDAISALTLAAELHACVDPATDIANPDKLSQIFSDNLSLIPKVSAVINVALHALALIGLVALFLIFREQPALASTATFEATRERGMDTQIIKLVRSLLNLICASFIRTLVQSWILWILPHSK